MKWVLSVLSALVIVVAVAIVYSYTLPARTTTTRTITLKQTPEAVFAVLADVQKLKDWNRNTEMVELLPPIDGKEATKQTFKGGMTMTIVTSESMAPTHLVREARYNSGPFVGSWTYEISPTADGSTVALTEKSEIPNPFHRFMVRIVGVTKYMDEHLVDLGKHFGEETKPLTERQKIAADRPAEAADR